MSKIRPNTLIWKIQYLSSKLYMGACRQANYSYRFLCDIFYIMEGDPLPCELQRRIRGCTDPHPFCCQNNSEKCILMNKKLSKHCFACVFACDFYMCFIFHFVMGAKFQ